MKDASEEAAVADTVLWVSGRVVFDVFQPALVPVLVRIYFYGACLRGLPQEDVGYQVFRPLTVFHLEWCSRSSSHKKNYSKIKKKILPPFYERNGFLNFVQNLFSTLYNIYFSHQDRFSRFRENFIFEFFKFVHNFCKKQFFELILGVNSSCNGSHLPSKYGSNPGGGTQTMLILLRPLLIIKNCKFFECI